LRIEDVTPADRGSLLPVIDQSFTGLYRWHARRTLGSIRWARAAVGEGSAVGAALFTLIGEGTGYLYYVAVLPSNRGSGVGGMLVDDAIQVLRAQEAREAYACVRPDNVPSVKLIQSRGFTRTSFGELARTRGFPAAARLWAAMVVAPGEGVFRRDL
jgi:ribosomal protein S18 acetylase RimI-like enzyme